MLQVLAMAQASMVRPTVTMANAHWDGELIPERYEFQIQKKHGTMSRARCCQDVLVACLAITALLLLRLAAPAAHCAAAITARLPFAAPLAHLRPWDQPLEMWTPILFAALV